ncbi:hypothetical protein [Romboutsia lituseburensis]|uniref:hypothetical protein n=1 Tax=Romboutsia lituseburensis TaxID=1537 RepID=UPI0022EB306B|nr:hypothetical protein [Romboutsia lituseburensis]
MKKEYIAQMSILEVAELIKIRSEQIKKEKQVSDLKAFNQAYKELLKEQRGDNLCL